MAWFGTGLKDHEVPVLLPQARLADQAAQGSIQPGLEHLQRWGIHSFSGKPVPASHHPNPRLQKQWK